MDLSHFEGLTPDEGQRLADELGLALRLIEPGSLHTMEFRSDRVTADLVDGRITGARIG